MKVKTLLWCMATLMLPIMLNPVRVLAVTDSTNDTPDTIDTSVLSTYETFDDDTIETNDTQASEVLNEDVADTSYDTTIASVEATTVYDGWVETTADTTTLEALETTVDSTADTTEDTTTQETTTEESTVTTTEETTPEPQEVGNVSVVPSYDSTTVANAVSLSSIETTTTHSTSNGATVVSDAENVVHTLSNTDIAKTTSSPKTNQVTVIVPVLLLMAGALFMSATANPKNSKRQTLR